MSILITTRIRSAAIVATLLIMMGCARIDRDDLPGIYVLDTENGERMLSRFDKCIIELKSDSTFLISNCSNTELNASYSWRYLRGVGYISVDMGKYSTLWEIEKKSGCLMIFERLDEGEYGKVYFKRRM